MSNVVYTFTEVFKDGKLCDQWAATEDRMIVRDPYLVDYSAHNDLTFRRFWSSGYDNGVTRWSVDWAKDHIVVKFRHHYVHDGHRAAYYHSVATVTIRNGEAYRWYGNCKPRKMHRGSIVGTGWDYFNETILFRRNDGVLIDTTRRALRILGARI